MTTPDNGGESRKPMNIVLALDASPLSIAAMDETVLLAERLKAKLTVLCVEDANILKLVNQPHARTISAFSTGISLDSASVKTMFKLQVQAAQQALTYAIGTREIDAVLKVRSGNVVAEILAESAEADMLVMGWSGWQAASYYSAKKTKKKNSRYDFVSQGSHHLGSSVKAIVKKANVPVLVLRNTVSDAESVAVIYNGSDNAKKALQMAATTGLTVSGLKEDKKQPCCVVTVCLMGENVTETIELRKQATEILQNSGVEPSFLNMPVLKDDVEMVKNLVNALHMLPHALLVIGAETPMFARIEQNPDQLENLTSSVLVVH